MLDPGIEKANFQRQAETIYQLYLPGWPLTEIGQLSVTGERCALNTGCPLRLTLPRKSVVRVTDRLDMTLAVYHRHKATNQ